MEAAVQNGEGEYFRGSASRGGYNGSTPSLAASGIRFQQTRRIWKMEYMEQKVKIILLALHSSKDNSEKVDLFLYVMGEKRRTSCCKSRDTIFKILENLIIKLSSFSF